MKEMKVLVVLPSGVNFATLVSLRLYVPSKMPIFLTVKLGVKKKVSAQGLRFFLQNVFFFKAIELFRKPTRFSILENFSLSKETIRFVNISLA